MNIIFDVCAVSRGDFHGGAGEIPRSSLMLRMSSAA